MLYIAFHENSAWVRGVPVVLFCFSIVHVWPLLCRRVTGMLSILPFQTGSVKYSYIFIKSTASLFADFQLSYIHRDTYSYHQVHRNIADRTSTVISLDRQSDAYEYMLTKSET